MAAHLDTGSSWVALQSHTEMLCSGGLGLTCTFTGGGTTFSRLDNPPLPISFCLLSAACLNDAYGNASEEESASSNDNIAFANEELGNSGANLQPQGGSSEASQPSEPPAGWQKDESDISRGITHFTHVDENGIILEASFYHDYGELQVPWIDSLSQVKNHLPDLIDWLGDSVQTIKGYPTDNLATYFSPSSRGLALVNRMFSSTLENYGFGPATIVPEGYKMWIVFTRGDKETIFIRIDVLISEAENLSSSMIRIMFASSIKRLSRIPIQEDNYAILI